MRKIDLAVYVILTAIIGVAAYTVYDLSNNNKTTILEDKESLPEGALSTMSTGSTGYGDVAIDLTPIKIDNKNLVLSIAINTHSVELSRFDLKQITTLQYDGKAAYPADAPKIEGHHSSGNIMFNIGGSLKDFTVTIKGVPKVEERVYKWTR